MYGSDVEYQDMPHKYASCCCGNKIPHCWWCGQPEDNPMHIMTVDDGKESRDESRSI
jgi:hypothetical protein